RTSPHPPDSTLFPYTTLFRSRRAGVPVTPGSDGMVTEENEALKVAKKVGYPLMIKAVAGGGGRGMRAAHNDASFLPAFHAARMRSEEHTSELQSRENLVCRLL